MKTITLKRKFNFINWASNFEVLIDAKQVGYIKNNSSIELQLEDTAQELKIISDNFSSKPIKISDIPNDSILYLKPHYRSTIALLFFLIYLGIQIFEINFRWSNLLFSIGIGIHIYSIVWGSKSSILISIKKNN